MELGLYEGDFLFGEVVVLGAFLAEFQVFLVVLKGCLVFLSDPMAIANRDKEGYVFRVVFVSCFVVGESLPHVGFNVVGLSKPSMDLVHKGRIWLRHF